MHKLMCIVLSAVVIALCRAIRVVCLHDVFMIAIGVEGADQGEDEPSHHHVAPGMSLPHKPSQMTLAFVYTYFQFLYPNTTEGYPADPTIAGLTIREMWANLAEHNKQIAPPSYDIKQFCHYCETADDHAATARPKLKEGKVKCEICAEAVGKANAKYRGAKALGHHAGRCIAQYSMQTRNFPQDFMDRKPTDEELRKLSHATAVADMDTISNIFYTRYLASEWVGRDKLLDQAKRKSGSRRLSTLIWMRMGIRSRRLRSRSL
jgi:hypothetical protein